MTKKHYEAIASILRGYVEQQIGVHDRRDLTKTECDALEQASYDIADRLADYFATDNPRFDRVRFLTACGIEQDEVLMCNDCAGMSDSDKRKCPHPSYNIEQEERCECGNLPYTDTENCKDCCACDKCTYGCGTCFCGCHNVEETGGKLQE
jgi:hypothetical protein